MSTIDFVVKNGLVVNEDALIKDTTDSSSKDTGALIVEGGVGIEKKLYVGTDAVIGTDLAVNGGDITSSATTFNLLNSTVTTGNLFGAGTTVSIGSSTGTTTINNANTVVTGDLAVNGGDLTTSQTTFNLVNTTATTVNLAGAATDVQIGAATGTTEINNNLNVVGDVDIDGGDLTVSTASFNLVNTTATTVNFAGAATTLSIGSASGTTTINNAATTIAGTLNANGGAIVTDDATFNLINTNATTVNFAGAGTAVSIGASTGTTTVNNNFAVNGNTTIGNASSDTITFNANSGLVPNTLTLTTDDAVADNLTYPLKLSHTTSGTPATGIGTGIQFIAETSANNNEIGMILETITTDVTANSEDFDFVLRLMKAGNTAAEAFRVSSTGDISAIGDIQIQGGDLTTNQTTFNLLNSTATTVNFAGAATDVQIGAGSGITTVNNNLTVDLNLTVTGDATIDGDLLPNADDTGAVGTAAKTWNDGRFTNLTIDGTLNVRTKLDLEDSDIIEFGTGSDATFNYDGTANTFSLSLGTDALSFIIADGSTTKVTIEKDGDIITAGDLALNGGDLTTSATTFNLVNTTATTVSLAGAATTLNIGNATAAQTVYVGGTSSGASTYYFGTGGTTTGLTKTVNLGTGGGAGSTTNVNLGSTNGGTITLNANAVLEGDIQVKGGDITTNQTTFNLLNTTATTVNFGGAATAIEIGSSTGTTNINNNLDVDGDINIDGDDITTSVTTFNLLNTTATTINFSGAATTLNIGNATAAQTISIGNSSTGASTYNFGTAPSANTLTKTVNLGTGGAAGTTTNINIGSSVGGTTTINSPAFSIGGQMTFPTAIANRPILGGGFISQETGDSDHDIWGISEDYYPSHATAANAWGIRWDSTNNEIEYVGGGTNRFVFDLDNGDLTMTGNLNLNATSMITNQTAFNLLNTTATTINFGGAATTVEIGAATGTTNVNNNLDVDGDINIDGGDLTSSATTFNLFGSTVTTLNAGSATSGTLNILYNTASTTTSTGALVVSGGVGVSGAIRAGSIQNTPIGSTTASTGAFTSLTANGAVTFTAGTASTSTSTGTLVVTGGVGISGALYATSKSFDIEHPTKSNMRLRHGSLEGPEFGVYVRGHLVDSHVIELPDYWIGLVDPETITVNVTPKGRPQEIFVKYISNNRIHLAGDDIDCYFIVYAERKDINKIEVEGE